MAEYLPSAHAILWFLAAFVSLWGWSLVWRGWLRAEPGAGRWRPRGRLLWPGLGVQVLAAAAGYFGQWAYGMSGLEAFDAPDERAWTAAGWGVLAFGAFVVVLAYRGDRPAGRLRCRRCRYDMSAAVIAADGTRTCPECGRVARSEWDLLGPRREWRRRPRWRAVVAGLVIALASYGVMVVPGVRATGWIGAVPTWTMALGVGVLPDSVVLERGHPRYGSLLDRYLSGYSGGIRETWERRFIHRWARRVAVSETSSVAASSRAAAFLQYPADSVFARGAFMRLMGGLVSESEAERREGALGLMRWTFYNIDRRDVAPFATRLIEGLDDPDADVATCCARYLAFCGKGGEGGVDRLIQLLSSASSLQATLAEQALQSIAAESPTARDKLIAALRRAVPPAHRSVGAALGNLRGIDPELANTLRGMLADPSDSVAEGAVIALTRSRPRDLATFDAILVQVRSGRQNREVFMRALVGSVDSTARPRIPEVTALLSDSSPVVRKSAAGVLLDLARNGANVSSAAPTLRRLVESKDASAGVAQGVLDVIRVKPQWNRGP